MEVIILAGGLGTRLQLLLNSKPKALAEIAGRPFLSYVIEYLRQQNVTRFIFSLGFLADQIIEFLKQNHSSLSYVISLEDSPLGTGGAIKKALQYSNENDVLIVNADTFFKIDLQEMYAAHQNSDWDCTLALKKMKDFDRYGTVELDSDGHRIRTFKEKVYQTEGLINGGYMFINRKSFGARHTPEIFSFEKDFLEPNLETLNIQGYISDGYFIDIGIPADYEKAQEDFLNFNSLLK